mmetsp:Transcript_14213/g.42833  ORF Transcript_14213/g.42833 Transcript_14213/m.42833 type:complete len:109 (+) Transcript_14213:642-968(+)
MGNTEARSNGLRGIKARCHTARSSVHSYTQLVLRVLSNSPRFERATRFETTSMRDDSTNRRLLVEDVVVLVAYDFFGLERRFVEELRSWRQQLEHILYAETSKPVFET